MKSQNRNFPTPAQLARFQREFKLTRALDLEGTVAAYDLVKHNKNLYMVLEDFQGEPIYSSHRNEPTPLEIFFEKAEQVVETLGEIHQRRIIHKDLNPSNILWNAKVGKAKIIDFGLASEISRVREDPSALTGFEGSLPYISPEQTGRTNREVDFRTDYYSLGVTFFQMVTGRLPFNAEDMMGWVYAHIAMVPPNPFSLNPAIPTSLAGLILKLIAKKKEDRYQSTHGLLHDLKICRQHFRDDRLSETFQPGVRDVSGSFDIPQKIYGREHEVETLMEVFGKVVDGENRFVMVGGYSGVGKSTLIQEISTPIIREQGYFISGKFEQYKHDMPYSALIQALRQLIRHLLSEPSSRLRKWRKKMLDVLGPNGRLMTDLIPELVPVIGEQPEIQKFSPAEAQSRFNVTFINFFSVFASDHHPLVLFLDDLQWVDGPSLNLIKAITASSKLRNIMLIVAYRDNEIGPGHPFTFCIDEIQSTRHIDRLEVKPLSQESVNHIVMETVHEDAETIEPLSSLIFRKTQGNPFFVNELLMALYRKEILEFQPNQGVWSWSMKQVEKAALGDNVVDFLIKRLNELPADVREALQFASCIGNRFPLKTLCLIMDLEPEKVAGLMIEAIKDGFLQPLGNKYDLVGFLKKEDFKVGYQFRHDRIQQAAHALIDRSKRKQVHLAIGRLLLEHTPEEDRSALTIDIVTQFNEGVDLITDEQERLTLAQLNLAAASRARASTAFQSAYRYLVVGLSLMTDEHWETNYQLCYMLHHELMECAYLCGKHEESEREAEQLLTHATDPLERADVLYMQVNHYTTMGRQNDSLSAGLRGIQELGLELTEHPDADDLMAALGSFKAAIFDRNILDLINLPEMKNPADLIGSQLLIELMKPAYLSGNVNLYILLLFMLAENGITKGQAPYHSYIYPALGTLLACVYNEAKTGHEISVLGLEISKRFKDMEYKGRAFYSAAQTFTFTSHWREVGAYFREALDATLQNGDLYWTAWACTMVLQWETQSDLALATELDLKYMEIVKTTYFQDGIDLYHIYQRLRLNLSGRTEDRLSLNGPDFNEDEILARLESTNFTSGIVIFHLAKMQICLLYGEDADALNHYRASIDLFGSITSLYFMVEYSFFSFLTLSRNFLWMSRQEQKEAQQHMDAERMRMKIWADACPDNFEHLCCIMDAETARLAGDTYRAAELYDNAIKASQSFEFLRYEALANELASKYYVDQERENLAGSYMRDAYFCYRVWGAKEKENDLITGFGPLLRHRRFAVEETISQIPSTSNFSGMELDGTTFAKVSQALSREVMRESLIRRLMNILKENAGAQKILLALVEGEENALVVQGVSKPNRDAEVMMGTSLKRSDEVPLSLVQFVTRTWEPVLLGQAAYQGDFTNDPYVRRNLPLSVLCMAIVQQGKLVGILYMENNLDKEVFTTRHLEVLEVLVTQAAISLENTRLYDELRNLNIQLEQKVEDRTQELRAKNVQILSSLNYAQRIQQAILPDIDKLKKLFSDSFIIYKPRDIVSGDFYWWTQYHNYLVIALVDCTGHGVPGAFMSMIGNTLLGQIVNVEGIIKPNKVLETLNHEVRLALKQERATVHAADGMEMGLCCLDRTQGTLEFAGACFTLYVSRPGRKLYTVKGDRHSIGGKQRRQYGPFTNHRIQLERGDSFYLFTDGFTDQPNMEGARFGKPRLRQLLTSMNKDELDMDKQRVMLEEKLEIYGNAAQRDDISAIGIQF